MQFIVSLDYHDVRLDRFLRQQYADVTLPNIFRLLRKGRIRVNGKRKKPGYRLKENDVVQVFVNLSQAAPQKILSIPDKERLLALGSIVYEDDNLAVCNKPPGVAMHRGSGHEFGFVEMLQAATQNPCFSFVHRIDKATSGLVVGAKNKRTARELSALLRKHEVAKYYMIVVGGLVPDDRFILSSYLKKEEKRVVESPDSSNGAKKAVSEVTVVRRLRQHTLLKARLITGRTHQLRVQLAGRGNPIVGDIKYGGVVADNLFLFSSRVVIKALDVDICLPAPDFMSNLLNLPL